MNHFAKILKETSVAWSNTLQHVESNPDLLTLALGSFGVPPERIGAAYGLDLEGLQASFNRALSRGVDRTPPVLKSFDYLFQAVGLSVLKDLLARDAHSYAAREMRITRTRAEGLHDLVLIDGRPRLVPDPAPHIKVNIAEPAARWFDQIHRMFLRKRSGTDLLVLLPGSGLGARQGHWTVLRAPRFRSTFSCAVRVLSGLAVLGMTRRESGHRNLFLGDLASSCELLSSQFWVTGRSVLKATDCEQLCRQMMQMPEGVLLQRPPDDDLAQLRGNLSVFALDFSDTWKGKSSSRFTDWSIRDRAGDSDELTNALLMLFLATSGVCVHIHLPAPSGRGSARKHDVRVVAPKAWIEFMQEGHGAKRKEDVFSPYLGRDKPGVPLLCIDEPRRYAQTKALRAGKPPHPALKGLPLAKS